MLGHHYRRHTTRPSQPRQTYVHKTYVHQHLSLSSVTAAPDILVPGRSSVFPSQPHQACCTRKKFCLSVTAAPDLPVPGRSSVFPSQPRQIYLYQEGVLSFRHSHARSTCTRKGFCPSVTAAPDLPVPGRSSVSSPPTLRKLYEPQLDIGYICWSSPSCCLSHRDLSGSGGLKSPSAVSPLSRE